MLQTTPIMNSVPPTPTHLQNYRPPAYAIEQVSLDFQLSPEKTLITSTLTMRQKKTEALTLQGVGLELISLKLDGQTLPETHYQLTPEELTIPSQHLSQTFTLESTVMIDPSQNKSLEGLYLSNDILCTQCEAEGFRRITYFLDRPDVMSTYKVRLEADQTRYPTLLSNGNPLERGELPNGRHYVVWEDPFKKSCYLFALVAGKLGIIKDSHTTPSGKTISLEIYCDPGNESRCLHAMESLKKSMAWDEEKFNLEYDLDIYMIVAVDAFNAGAMENKGLNIFNSSYVLADPQSATDLDYQTIESIIGHEYFHNWTGNRVTCRDWFQLTLKEGLTVYRDQEFSCDMQSREVERIKAIQSLKTSQFAEDAGPMAHPIQPKSYMKIDNFYTATVYNKGAEVIRMVTHLIGWENFRRGMDKYFELYDGQAVTTEDFIRAMEQASGQDLKSFQETWYHQAGTPVIHLEIQSKTKREEASPPLGGVELIFSQSTPTQKHNQPFTLPFPIALYNRDGKFLEEKKLLLSRDKESFWFPYQDVIPSLNLGFSSPVKISYNYSEEELTLLMKYDLDPCNRFYACQQRAMREILTIKDQMANKQLIAISQNYLEAYQHLILDESLDPALKAYGLGLPSFEEVLEEQADEIDFCQSEIARQTLLQQLSGQLREELTGLYHKLISPEPYRCSPPDIARRLLKNTALSILAQREDEEVIQLITQQYDGADNMTDQMAAIKAMSHHSHPERTRMVEDFYDRWKDDPTVFNKWLGMVAAGRFPGTLDHLTKLTELETFDITIPNHVRSVLMGLIKNPLLFHQPSGEGYRFLANFSKTYDSINPQVCARILATLLRKVTALTRGKKILVDGILQDLQREQLSQNTQEVITAIRGALNNLDT